MSYLYPTIQQFETQFARDFPFGTDPQTQVLDSDVANAFVFANINFNPCLWDDQPSFQLAFNLLSAHYLVLNLRSSSQGINGQFNWAQQSKSVGSVSEGFAIPQRIMDNPELMMLTKTNYGALYLQLLLPQLAGQTFTVCGTTLP